MGRRNTRLDEMKRRAVPKTPDKKRNTICRRSVASSWNFALTHRRRPRSDIGDQTNTTAAMSQLSFQQPRPMDSSSRQHLHKIFARHKLTQVASSTKPQKSLSSCESQVSCFAFPTLQWLDSSGVRINNDDFYYRRAKEFGRCKSRKINEFSGQSGSKNVTMFKLMSPTTSSPKPNFYKKLNDTGSAKLKEIDFPSYQDSSVYLTAEEFSRHDREKKKDVTKASDKGDLQCPSDITNKSVHKASGYCGDDHKDHIAASRDLDLKQQGTKLPGTFPPTISGLDIPVTVIYSSSRPFLSASSRATNISSRSTSTIPVQNDSSGRYVEEYNKSAGILTTCLISHTQKEDEVTASTSCMSSIREEDLDTFFMSEVLSQPSSNLFLGSESLTSDLLSEVSAEVSLSGSASSEELSPLPFGEAGLTTQSKLYLALLSDWEADQRRPSTQNPSPPFPKGVSLTPPPRPSSPPTRPHSPPSLPRRRLHIDLLATQVPSPPPPPPPRILAATASEIMAPKRPDRTLQPPSPPPPPPIIRTHLPSRPPQSLHPARLAPPPSPPPPPKRCSLCNLTLQSHRVLLACQYPHSHDYLQKTRIPSILRQSSEPRGKSDSLVRTSMQLTTIEKQYSIK